MAPKRQSEAVKLQEGFTPERFDNEFENELKSLAVKAKEQTWSKHAKEQASVYVKSLVLLALIAIYSNLSQLALSPVYGSIPASIWHSKLVMVACFVGWSGNLTLGRQLPVKPYLLLPVIALYIPYVQFYLFKFSGMFTAEWGPLITETLTLFPLMVLSVSCVATYLDDAELPGLPKWIGDALPGLGSWGLFKMIEGVIGNHMQSFAGRSFVQTRLGLEILLGTAYSIVFPSKLLLFAIPAILHTSIFNTHVPTSIALRSLQNSLNSNGWLLIDRKESLTGYISVLESLKDGFRVMRCDHSLLGGEWVKFPGSRVAEPIYGVFAMLEAVRLVEVLNPVPDSKAKALVM
jgi:hypothetical protein